MSSARSALWPGVRPVKLARVRGSHIGAFTSGLLRLDLALLTSVQRLYVQSETNLVRLTGRRASFVVLSAMRSAVNDVYKGTLEARLARASDRLDRARVHLYDFLDAHPTVSMMGSRVQYSVEVAQGALNLAVDMQASLRDHGGCCPVVPSLHSTAIVAALALLPCSCTLTGRPCVHAAGMSLLLEGDVSASMSGSVDGGDSKWLNEEHLHDFVMQTSRLCLAIDVMVRSSGSLQWLACGNSFRHVVLQEATVYSHNNAVRHFVRGKTSSARLRWEMLRQLLRSKGASAFRGAVGDDTDG
jgi:hypothetical protein